jgi:F-type H+-transporting ATPase subunit delta
MLARSASRLFSTARLVAAAEKAAPAAAASSELVVTFALPSKAVVSKKELKRVTVPAKEGVMGIEKSAPTGVYELGPGQVTLDHMDGSREDYFIPGGWVFKHQNNSVDLSSVEAVKLDSIDVEALRSANAEAVKRRDAANPGSKEQAEAKIAIELYRTLGQSLKVNL